MQVKYTEKFISPQGEGKYTGKPTVWLRFFSCNLQCDGFGQKNPTLPATHVLPYKTINISKIDNLTQLPVFDYGCDSSYSWSARFKHLIYKDEHTQIAEDLQKFVGTFNKQHLAFTGGEPMLQQKQMIAIMDSLVASLNFPKFVTVETNGTVNITKETIEAIKLYNTNNGIEWFWSVSPKLWNVSGEQGVVLPEVIAKYKFASDVGQLKFVVNASDEAWGELEDTVQSFKDVGNDWEVYVMPVGATVESQTGTINKDLAIISNKAVAHGWSVSGRLHCNIYGNTPCT